MTTPTPDLATLLDALADALAERVAARLAPAPAAPPAPATLTVTLDEAAALLGVSRPTVYRLCMADELPFIRAGKRKMVISRSALDRFIRHREAPYSTNPRRDDPPRRRVRRAV